MHKMAPSSDDRCVNMSYPVHQQARDLQSGKGERAAAWQDIIRDILHGTAQVGTRSGWADRPVWTTPRVLYGGFVSRELLANGPLLPHELELYRTLVDEEEEKARDPSSQQRHVRRKLNEWSIGSKEGVAYWLNLLDGGNLRLDVPEESAALVVALLYRSGVNMDAAKTILKEIAPWFETLRFFPRPSRTPAKPEATFLRSLGDVTCRELKITLRPRKPQLIEAWALTHERELYDLAADLTILLIRNGSRDPTFRTKMTQLHDMESRALAAYYKIHYGWRISYADVLSKDVIPTFFRKTGYATLRMALDDADNGSAMTDTNMARVSKVLAKRDERRSLQSPSPHLSRYGSAAEWSRANPTVKCDAVRDTLLERIYALKSDPDMGLTGEQIEAVLRAPLSKEEAVKHGGKDDDAAVFFLTGTPVTHPRLVKTLMRCKQAPLHELVEDGIIGSSVVLAKCAEPLVACLRSNSLRRGSHPEAHLAASMTARAFFRRRSVLLLNMDAQARLRDLPWFRALEDAFATGQEGTDTKEEEVGSILAVKELTRLHVSHFGGQRFPNELVTLVSNLLPAQVFPVIKEVASDIFQYAFTYKYVRQAQLAARTDGKGLGGTLYEKYYQLGDTFEEIRSWPFVSVDDGDDGEKEKQCAAFYRICEKRSKDRKTMAGPVMSNAMCIEQAAVVTGDNLLLLLQLALSEIEREGALDTLKKGITCATKALARELRRLYAVTPSNDDFVCTGPPAAALRNLLIYVSMLFRYDVEGSNASLYYALHVLDAEYSRHHLCPLCDAVLSAVRQDIISACSKSACGPCHPVLLNSLLKKKKTV